MALESLSTAAEHLMAAKMFSLASCVMLFYDIVITFGDEVERIWKQRFTGATILWFLNRYLSPLGYIVVIVSFHSNWPIPVCNTYVLYPEVLKIFTAFTIGVIFILRLYAIYARDRLILYSFSLLLMGELGTKIWAFTDGTRLVLPPELHGCILTGKSASGKRIVYTWVAELIFDTCVFFATLYRTVSLYRASRVGVSSKLIKVIIRDGIMYFAVIFVSNLVTVLIFVGAPPDLKVVNASFSTLITSLMVSRLMLNLRRGALHHKPTATSARDTNCYVYPSHSHRKFGESGNSSDTPGIIDSKSSNQPIASGYAGHTTTDMSKTTSSPALTSLSQANLRSSSDNPGDVKSGYSGPWLPPVNTQGRGRNVFGFGSSNDGDDDGSSRNFEDTIIGNLGAPIEGWGEEDPEFESAYFEGHRITGFNNGGARMERQGRIELDTGLEIEMGTLKSRRTLGAKGSKSIPLTVEVEVSKEVHQVIDGSSEDTSSSERTTVLALTRTWTPIDSWTR